MSTVGRDLSWKGFLALVVAYLLVLKGIGPLIGLDVEGDSAMPTSEVALRNFILPIGLSGLFGVAVVTWLGWWPQVIRDRHPVRRWVWFVPIFMIVVALASFNYGHLADQTAGLVLALLGVGLVIGFSEELWFRGIGVNVFRRSGFSEGYVALWSSLIFGAVHITNAFGEGPQAVAQAVIVSTSGYFFYLCLRVGGVIFLPMVVHGLWDASLLSSPGRRRTGRLDRHRAADPGPGHPHRGRSASAAIRRAIDQGVDQGSPGRDGAP